MFADAIDEFPKRLYWQKGHSLFGFSSISHRRPIILSGNRRLVLQRNVLAHFPFIGCDISFCNAFPYFILSKLRCCAHSWYHAWYFWGYKTWLKTVRTQTENIKRFKFRELLKLVLNFLFIYHVTRWLHIVRYFRCNSSISHVHIQVLNFIQWIAI